jgi:hypothetical protein
MIIYAECRVTIEMLVTNRENDRTRRHASSRCVVTRRHASSRVVTRRHIQLAHFVFMLPMCSLYISRHYTSLL